MMSNRLIFMRPPLFGWLILLAILTALGLGALSAYTIWDAHRQIRVARQEAQQARAMTDSALAILRRGQCIFLPGGRCAWIRDPADTVRMPIR